MSVPFYVKYQSRKYPERQSYRPTWWKNFFSCDSLFLGTSSWQPRLTIHMQLCKNSACLKLSECLPYKAEPVPAEERGFEPSMHPKGFSHELYKIMFVHIFLFKISLLGTAWLKKARKCGLNKYLREMKWMMVKPQLLKTLTSVQENAGTSRQWRAEKFCCNWASKCT